MLQCFDKKLRFHEQSRAEIWFFTQNLGCCLIGHLYIMQNRVSLPRCSGGWVQHYPGHTVGVCFFDNLIQLNSKSLWGDESKPLAVPILKTSLHERLRCGHWQSSVFKSWYPQVRYSLGSLFKNQNILKLQIADGLQRLPQADSESFLYLEKKHTCSSVYTAVLAAQDWAEP